jgi:DDE superfamily endonuclease
MAGKRRMDYFFSKEMDPESVINMTESGYSNNEVGLSYIKHFIEATESSPSSIKKLLLYDGHDSHCTEEFKAIAAENNIILYKFPPHLTHILQPLDVGCFQPYKHWHSQAVHHAIRTLQPRYIAFFIF